MSKEFDNLLGNYSSSNEWDLTRDVCEACHSAIWPRYRLVAIKQHPNGLVLLAKLHYEGDDRIDVAIGTNPRVIGGSFSRHVRPYWITCDLDYHLIGPFVVAAMALPDAKFPIMEVEASLEEILTFQELVKAND